jgi:hypothetical protein
MRLRNSGHKYFGKTSSQQKDIGHGAFVNDSVGSPRYRYVRSITALRQRK